MSDFFNKLATKHVVDLQPYQSARRIGGHGHNFLNANESSKSELYMFNSTTLHRYPDCQPQEVVTAYADYVGVPHNQVLVSRGSDEAIGLIVRTFCEPYTDGIVIAPPTYGMYEIAAVTNMAKVAYAKRNADFTINAQAFIDAAKAAPFNVKAVIIDCPANPLGILFSKEELIKLLEALPNTLIVMDEAYIEFASCNDSCVDLMEKYQNLVILRTLSKAFALAGLRCGFALARPEIIALLTKVIDPYPIPDPVAQIARQALARGGIELMRERVTGVLERKAILKDELLKLSFVKHIHESHANFLLVEFTNGPKVFDYVAQKGIILRSFETKPGLKNHIRISIGSSEELNELMRALSSFEGN